MQPQGSHSPYILGDTSRPRHITCFLVWPKSDQRRLRKTLHKQTDRETDTTKIMVTWPWTKKLINTSGYATWFMAGGAIRIAHYDVIDDVIIRKLSEIEKNGDNLGPWNPVGYPMVQTANRIALRQVMQNRKLRRLWRHNLGSRWKLQINGLREF